MESSKYSVCPGCEALMIDGQGECPNCGWGYEVSSASPSGGAYVDPGSYSDSSPFWEYGVFVAVTAEELAALLNERALHGWEAISVYGGIIEERPHETTHFAVMRRHNR